jgi:hypothetical protein
MSRKYSENELSKLRSAMEEYLWKLTHGNNIEYCSYCKKDKIEVWDDNFIPLCSSCNIDVSQMLEYFFDKYPEIIEEILSQGKPPN